MKHESTSSPVIAESGIEACDIESLSHITVLPDEHEIDTSSLMDYCTKWILKTGETRKLTRTALTGIVRDTSELIEEVLLNVESQVHASLRSHGVDVDLSSVFSMENELLRPFHNLSSFPLQLKYYREHFDLIVSITACIYLLVLTLIGTRKNNIGDETNSDKNW